jgi:hypothetical protein
VTCTTGSRCAIDCNNALTCAFTQCQGELVMCPGNRLVCNRDCP